MVREDDSDIKGASDTVPALRNREDQRGTQREGRLVSTQGGPKGWHYLGEFSGFRLVLQSQNPDLSAHQELIHYSDTDAQALNSRRL